MEKTKPEFRYKYYKTAKNTLLTITSGLGAAFVALIVQQPDYHSTNLAVSAIVLVCFSILINITTSFMDYLGSGFYFDSENAKSYDVYDSRAKDDEKLAKIFGKTSGLFFLLELIFTFSWVILMTIFVIKNI